MRRGASPTVMSISPTRLTDYAKTWRGREATSRQRCCRIVFIFVSDSMRSPSWPPTIMPRPANRPCANACVYRKPKPYPGLLSEESAKLVRWSRWFGFFWPSWPRHSKSKLRLEAENAVLRHQLIALRRRMRGRAQPTNNDRWFLVQMYRWFPAILQVLTIIRPETLVRWHRADFRCCWRWKSRRRGGRPQIDTELRALIRQMSTENQLWGAPRIHGELPWICSWSRPSAWDSCMALSSCGFIAEISSGSRHSQPDSGVDRTPDHRGFSLGRCSALYDRGPRSDLRHHCHTPTSRHGHPR